MRFMGPISTLHIQVCGSFSSFHISTRKWSGQLKITSTPTFMPSGVQWIVIRNFSKNAVFKVRIPASRLTLFDKNWRSHKGSCKYRYARFLEDYSYRGFLHPRGDEMSTSSDSGFLFSPVIFLYPGFSHFSVRTFLHRNIVRNKKTCSYTWIFVSFGSLTSESDWV